MPKDFSEKQFVAALKRNGFHLRPSGLWLEHRDFPNHWFGCNWNPTTGKVMRRLSLANALKRVEQLRADLRAKARAA